MLRKLPLLCLVFALVSSASARPNVVFVISDDQGYGDLSCHGNPVLKTPNIDALHAESVRLTDYHVSPTCTPTRAALLTGHWTNRTGAWHTIAGRSMLRADEVTMADVFSSAGYATGMFGKWHLGDNFPLRPQDRGFSEVMIHGGGGVGQTPDFWDNAYFGGSYFHNGEVVKVADDKHCTDVWFDSAKDFIKAQKAADKPFFAYIATNAPHGPMHAPPEFAAPYEKDYDVKTAHFLGMIAHIDDAVGRLRDFLDAEELAENTIFIFTTDNGTAGGGKIHNAGMRAQKGSNYDGGHRVPFFVHWPAGGLTEGRDVDTLTAHVDILPTLIETLDLPAPEGVKFDGTSIKSLIENSAADWEERVLITDSQRVLDPVKWKTAAVMTERWRLNSPTELYDIEADPGQKDNIAKAHPEVVAELAKAYDAWWADIEPSFKKDVLIVLGDDQANPVTLTCHDWYVKGFTPWNHSAIREQVTTKKDNYGPWKVEIAESGDYEIELRRWPKELGAAVTAEVPAGEDVPGVQAYRARLGEAFAATTAQLQIGDYQLSAPVRNEAAGVTFKVKLEAGPAELYGKFLDAQSQFIGAYYAYVKKL